MDENKFFCCKCHYVGQSKIFAKGSFWIELILWLTFQTGIKVDRLPRNLETATGSYESARKAQEFLRAESERLGLVYLDQIKGYRGLAAASKSYNFTAREIQEIYLGVAEAATAKQMTQDDVNGVFLAFTQILSKGKLQAEEIRGQIGERLPGAFNIAAKAMGVTVAGLSKMLDLGQVMSEDFIPKFARQLRMEFAGGLDKAAQSAQANINRLKNTILGLSHSMWRLTNKIKVCPKCGSANLILAGSPGHLGLM